MLPIMFTNAKRNIIAGVTAFAVLASGAAPAMAWGKNEQQFLKGVAAALLVQSIIRTVDKPAYRPPVQQPRPIYYNPAPVSIYQTPVGQAFNTYSDNEQRRIQSTLSAYGYYRGSIDGSFGPGTYAAIQAYAAHTNRTASLSTRAGAYGFLDGLLF
jgi:hypothetical protein